MAKVDNNIVLESEVQKSYLEALSQAQQGIEAPTRCAVFESLLINKLMVAKAEVDSVIVTDAEVLLQSNNRFSMVMQQFGGDEAMLAEMYGKTAEQLKAAMLAATGIYCPDPQLSTAGIHFMKVLHGLGIAGTVTSKLHAYPNGNAAMNAMAACEDPHVMGCTQVTEILITAGIDLVANLPLEFELATMYTAGVRSTSTCLAEAQVMIDILISQEHAALRAKGGFLPLV